MAVIINLLWKTDLTTQILCLFESHMIVKCIYTALECSDLYS